jgi:hypothetical protein
MGVGGMEVFVGIADCVIANKVNADATAVFCRSVAFTPGSDFGPQATRARIVNKETASKDFLFIFLQLTTKA